VSGCDDFVAKPYRENAIFDAIERYLTRHPRAIELAQATRVPTLAVGEEVFVDPPTITSEQPLPVRLQRLIRKFDPVERDKRNRVLGIAGEEFVLNIERRKLVEADRPDLARKVRWVTQEEGDGAGYDIYSFSAAGKERLLEVKTTNGSAKTPFFVSRNEYDLSQERASEWLLYRVHKFATHPRIFVIAPPVEHFAHLSPESWRASF